MHDPKDDQDYAETEVLDREEVNRDLELDPEATAVLGQEDRRRIQHNDA